MTIERPDPEVLLARWHRQQAAAAQGRLRIYFGASAGVGKTFAMLSAARRLQADGVDVLAGVIETHGRAETQALLQGLPLLPAAQVAARARTLPEFDLDEALRRRPALVLVDELAHSNVPGSRHPKRWQDVEELLAAGIGVYTTLNVQHLESLNDVVGGITGIRVQETLPDTFFDRADEVVLVDTPADELIARLRSGKVYMPAQAERAAAHFFRKGNLMALRELALRRTADRVEGDVQAWRVEQSISAAWKTEGALLCCVGPRGDGDHVVRSAARLAQQLGVGWHAVYVETPALQRLANTRRQRILRSVELAETLGATTAVLAAQRVPAALVAHARHHNLATLLMGRNRPRGWWQRQTLAASVAALAPEFDVIEVGRAPGADVSTDPAHPPAPRDPVGLRYLWTALACLGTLAAAWPLRGVLDVANLVMLFLLAVVGVALRWGRGPAVLAAFLQVAGFDYFFVAPRLSFAVSDVQYLLTFGVMLTVGLVVGQLTAGLRFQARVATHREARSRALFEVARDLSSVVVAEQCIAIAEQAIAREFHAEARVMALDADEHLQIPVVAPELDAGTARWALDHGEPAGLGTDTLPGSPWLYLPLKAPMRARGVLAFRPEAPRLLLVPEQRRQLDTFALLTAIALERVHYVAVAQHATVQMASERLRNSLLAALSHDLRTPLAALYGLADLLAGGLPPGASRDTAEALGSEARRMNAMVDKLLDMARLQSGTVQLRRQWQPIEEVVGSALRSLGQALSGHRVRTEIPPGLPLVEIDAVLIERVLANLLENAAKYTPAGSTVGVSAGVEATELRVRVADDGPGLPDGPDEALFEKFTRGDRESAVSGMGLGLAICRAIVEAHGGRIGIDRGVARGAAFSFRLPLGRPPAMPAEAAVTSDVEGMR